MDIQFIAPTVAADSTYVTLCLQEQEPLEAAAVLKPVLADSTFKGKKGQTEVVQGATAAPGLRTVVLGMGKEDALTVQALQEAGGNLYARLADIAAAVTVSLAGWEKQGGFDAAAVAAHMAQGALLRSYRFDKYKTRKDDDDKPVKPKLQKLAFRLGAHTAAQQQFAALKPLAGAVHLVRDLQNEPANIIYPESLALRAKAEVEPLGVKVTILGEEAMRTLGMGALLGVGQGSARESQMVVMEYRGADDRKAAPVAFVGKGVTFDTGGISIKPSAGMEDMKWDMGGSGVVIGTMKLLAERKAKVNAIGVVGLVENMPSGTAQRPGDIVTSMSGQTIEVLNTDAEGRLVLADALWYTQEKYKPSKIIDLATLTGAIVVALGEITAGLFSNDDALAAELSAAATAVAEPLWRMPMNDDYDKDIDSDFADVKNIGSGRGAGSTTAAQFLQRFIQKGTVWAHLDIAGVTWTKKPTPLCPKGATAFGVRLLDAWVRGNLEKTVA